eukprot:6372167-Pyramimonas_sp.AAC.1
MGAFKYVHYWKEPRSLIYLDPAVHNLPMRSLIYSSAIVLSATVGPSAECDDGGRGSGIHRKRGGGDGGGQQ